MRRSPIGAPPLRFLALVLGGWICLRAAILAPGLWPETARRVAKVATFPEIPAAAAAAKASPAKHRDFPSATSLLKVVADGPNFLGSLPAQVEPALHPDLSAPQLLPPAQTAFLEPIQPLAPPAADVGRRWSASAWVLLRGERGGPGLAPAGTLGGSQAGARILYRLGDGLSLSARAYVPMRRPGGAEAAAGLDWQPVASIPAGILVERRQAVGREGRSAFSVIFHGGAGRALPGGLRLDAYAQAGIVGFKSRDAFVDGSARVSAGLGPVEVGAGAWAAAQPGAARLDAGPALTYRLPVARARLRLEADWRFRIAGDAAPGSGPALTLAADF